jgi:hypothetical protein
MKFNIGDIVEVREKGLSIKTGMVIECAPPGSWTTGTSNGLETRYRIKWNYRGPRTWYRESGLHLVKTFEVTKSTTDENEKIR